MNERMRRKFVEQLQAIQTSCAAYDAGIESEALRIAVSLRVLFHRTPHSTPLVSHLKLDDLILLSSDAGPGDFKAYVTIEINLASPTPVKCHPKLGTEFVPLPFTQWWHEQPVHQVDGKAYHRRDIVLVAANQDGGAHVDARTEKFYEELASGTQGLILDGRELVYAGKPPFDQTREQSAENTHLAMLRQFAHEVLTSASHYNWMARVDRGSRAA